MRGGAQVRAQQQVQAQPSARAQQALLAVGDAQGSLDDVCQQIMCSLRCVAPFDCCAVVTVDPETLLPNSALVDGFSPEHCEPFWDNELLDADFNKFNELVRRSDPVATLVDAVDGDLARSPRYRKLYQPAGVVDELRVVFVAGSTCVGHATLVRLGDAEPFSPEEVDAVRDLAPTATQVLLQTSGRVACASRTEAPVVLILDAAGEVATVSAGGEGLLQELRSSGTEEPGLPIQVRAAATRARWSRTSTSLATRVRDRQGRWLRLHITPMDDESGSVAVMIEPAHPGDLVAIMLESYGLTHRETEVVIGLARGLSAREIAEEIHISAHTVRDHIKAIYDKAGVNSRGELMARLFSDHCLADFHASSRHLPVGALGAL